jgi:hypothetical protein
MKEPRWEAVFDFVFTFLPVVVYGSILVALLWLMFYQQPPFCN